MIRLNACLLLVIVGWLNLHASAQLTERTAGLLATLSDGQRTIQRVDYQPRWLWTANSQLDERLSAGHAITATWSGWLDISEEGNYQLAVHALGHCQVWLDGQLIIEGELAEPQWCHGPDVKLPFGQHELKIAYRAPADHGQLKLYWQGPGFQLEPLTARYLKAAPPSTLTDDFERGRMLAHALRCSSCHEPANVSPQFPAADLRAVQGNLLQPWLIDWLTSQVPESPSRDVQADDVQADDVISRRMPHLALSQQDASDIAAALWKHSEPLATDRAPKRPAPTATKKETGKQSDKSKASGPDAQRGRELVLTRGCIACHSLHTSGIGLRDPDDELNELPERRWDYFMYQLFSGGDLSGVGNKRPAHFFARWLSQPEKINADHRMPVPELEDAERDDMVLYLASLQSDAHSAAALQGDVQRGTKLIVEHRCGNCHQLPAPLQAPSLSPSQASPPAAPTLSASSHWDSGCLSQANAAAHRPGFGLTAAQRRALRTYWLASASNVSGPTGSHKSVDFVLAESNCLACHARDSAAGLGPRAGQLISVQRDLAARLPALLPPSLTGVGDKLHEAALASAIARTDQSHRPWLEIRMPKYRLSQEHLNSLIGQLVAQDRIPDSTNHRRERLPDDVVTRAAAGRLVTSEGFGCQSCHKIGNQPSPTVALNARGTDLTMLGQRIRQSWFDRWVRNPVRIVPRMEMPAIKLPVHGVMNNDLNRQIDAVWEMLNTPGFQPPAPAPVRVVRGHNDPQVPEAAHVLTDVLETSDAKYLRPLIVGLGNRHSTLFDLEHAQLARWWIGDTARELTRGKSWYWELGGQPLAARNPWLWQIQLLDRQQQLWRPAPREQFSVELDELEHTAHGLNWQGRVHLASADQRQTIALQVNIESLSQHKLEPTERDQTTGLHLRIKAALPSDARLVLQLHPECGELHNESTSSSIVSQLDERSQMRFASDSAVLNVSSAHQLQAAAKAEQRFTEVDVRLVTHWPVDSVLPATSLSSVADTPSVSADQPVQLSVVPGFRAIQLPLPRTEMPTALAWYKGQLAIGSLKGRVCLAVDSNGDTLPDRWQVISDDLPAPYGLAAFDGGLDVLAKFGLMRLSDPGQGAPDVPWKMETVADGWGYTADYHDWAVGLERDAAGNYLIALPCQQDERTAAAARLRGTIQKLIPQTPTSDDPRRFRLETVAGGQRFPMGLALDRQGRLFATDNQGNYNPFNELNHIQSGNRYGFINKLENKPGFNPPLESPAVNLPHPWTRSVNGICFLNTPTQLGPKPLFGPFEGHLVGCEYNGLSLIRISLEEIEGVMQGAAYLFSRTPLAGEATFEGPVVCAVSPEGQLTVGNIHDSGWGGGQNTGSIVQLTPTGQWPLGIATVKALSDGLRIEFTGRIDPQAAQVAGNYSIRSYRRVSTPAYGGNDQDERNEPILDMLVDPNHTAVELKLNPLRADAVYEVRVGQVAGAATLFPNEAHYTMKRVPK